MIPNRRQEENIHEPETEKPGSYKFGLLTALIFTMISVIIWSFMYTGFVFNFEVFLNRTINHFFWLLLLPYIVSLFFPKEKRTNVHFNIVTVAIFLGVIFLILGYFTTMPFRE
jgi:hypothetical protein